ncbi:MAG: YdeI/OmpD-associated family protein [Jatrophihabitantaceae bacterium]
MVTGEGQLQLRAVLEPRGPAGAIVLTDEQVASLGGTKTPPVQATVNGVTVAARVGRMGGENLLGFSKKLRAELGVEIGQTVDVTIARDEQPRAVELPRALAEALTADAAAKAAFDVLAPSHRKEFARWVDEAKREQTTLSRVEQTLQMLREGRTR